MRSSAVPLLRAAALVALLAACAHRGYHRDHATRRIYAVDSWGRVTRWYEPGTPEYEEIARRFWPELLERPLSPDADPPNRRTELVRFMRGLDRDQWHILLDMGLWTGDDLVDLSHLEELRRTALAVKGLPFRDYLAMKERTPIRSELRAKLLNGERE